jgi:hypothetical protein
MVSELKSHHRKQYPQKFWDQKAQQVKGKDNSIRMMNSYLDWGALKLQKSKYINYLNQEIPLDEVYVYDSPFRGSFYFQKYTDKQLESLKNLIEYLTETYNIPKDYKKDMWNISSSALAGSPEIYTHVSYRKDKSDCHPQSELIEILKNL